MAGANLVKTPETLEIAERVHNNLVAARLQAYRGESGLVSGYDDLSGRLQAAEGLVNEGIVFPELAWRMREARIFLNQLPDGNKGLEP